ncbi:MAG: Ig-like domain-containing protein [Cyclobacteriaceae bacterium]
MNRVLVLLLLLLICAKSNGQGDQQKTLIDFFLPMESKAPLVSEGVWGDQVILPRDTTNGLEDTTLKNWCYWDGMIVKDDEGKYHMYASRWDQKNHHSQGWRKESKATHAVADSPIGPYKDLGMTWPYWWEGAAHNTIGLKMHDGRYAMVTSEITRGEVFVSEDPYGPFEFMGELTTDLNGFRRGLTRYNNPPHKMANVMIIQRPDGRYMMMARWCAVLISDDGILGPYKVMTEAVWRGLPGVPQKYMEDPTVWHSDGMYHVVVNHYMGGDTTYHLSSEDGIHNWKNRGLAFGHNRGVFRYDNGDIDEWYTVQRPTVYVEDGKVDFFNFSVIDVHKGKDGGNDNHGSKIIVVPFDGEGFGKHMRAIVEKENAEADAASPPSEWQSMDLGKPSLPGNTGYSAEFNTVRITSSGNDLNGKVDQGRFVFQKMSGDVMISALIMSHDISSSPIKSGLMFRQDLKSGSKSLLASLEKDGSFKLNKRTKNKSKTITISEDELQAPYWIRLVKQGDKITSYVSQTNRFNWTKMGETTLHLDEDFYVGAIASSTKSEVASLARFKDLDAHPLGEPKKDIFFTHNLPDTIPESGKIMVEVEYECAQERKLSLGLQNTTTWKGYNSSNQIIQGYGVVQFEYAPNSTFSADTSYRFNISLLEKNGDWKTKLIGGQKETEYYHPYVAAKKIELSDRTIEILEGETFELSAEVSPSNAWEQKLYWSTQNPDLAQVDQVTGKVYGLKKGQAIIEVKNEKGVKSTCTVTVK